jgi:hypothetical protein
MAMAMAMEKDDIYRLSPRLQIPLHGIVHGVSREAAYSCRFQAREIKVI